MQAGVPPIQHPLFSSHVFPSRNVQTCQPRQLSDLSPAITKLRRGQFFLPRVTRSPFACADPNHIFAAHEGLPVADAVPSGAQGRRGDDSAPQQGRRLVPALHAGRESGHRDISGRDARAGEQARFQASPWCAGREGRAPRSLIEVSALLPLFYGLSRGRVGVPSPPRIE